VVLVLAGGAMGGRRRDTRESFAVCESGKACLTSRRRRAPNDPRTLDPVKGNLYRLSTEAPHGPGLITREGAGVGGSGENLHGRLVPRRNQEPVSCAGEVRDLFPRPPPDHVSGSQVFQEDGAWWSRTENALEPIIGEKLAMAVPDRIFEKDMTITLGGETVKLHHVSPSHSNSMIMVTFPQERAVQWHDVCGSRSLPFNDFPDFLPTMAG